MAYDPEDVGSKPTTGIQPRLVLIQVNRLIRTLSPCSSAAERYRFQLFDCKSPLGNGYLANY